MTSDHQKITGRQKVQARTFKQKNIENKASLLVGGWIDKWKQVKLF